MSSSWAVSFSLICVLSAEGICVMLHFIHSSHAWVSGCLLVAGISPAIIKSIAPYPCPFHWYHVCVLHLHQLVLYFHWCKQILIFFLSRVRHSAYSVFTRCISFLDIPHPFCPLDYGATCFTWKNHIALCNSMFGHVSSRPTVFKLIVWWYDMLTVPSHGCVTKQLIYNCLLHG